MKKTLTEEEFAKIIKCFHPDRTTQWVCMQMSCKHKKYEFCSQKHETKSMAAEDGRGQHNPMLKSIGEKGPRFHNGEAVKQWWAGWFRDARQPVMHASKKQRPKWYDGRVIMYIGVKKVWYAGREWEDHTYQVHWFVGKGEEVPENFLRRYEDDEKLAAHYGGVLLHQGPAPKYWDWDYNRVEAPGRNPQEP